MNPTRKRLGIIVSATIVSLMFFMGSIAEGQGQTRPQSPIVSSTLNLTMEQRHIIKEIIKDLRIENEPKNLDIKLGRVIPKTVLLLAMPVDISQKISQVKNHLFFLKNNQIVLVDPKDNKIVDLIDLK